MDDLYKLNPEDIKIEIFNKNYDVSDFESYEKELVKFLQEDALENQEQKLSVTFLWFYGGKIVSYITLLNDKINLAGNLKEFFREKEIHYNSLPALKIGRICVDNRFLRKKLGSYMVYFAIIIAKKISENMAGCRFITLDAKNNENVGFNPINFYKKLGFKKLKTKTNSTPMYFDLKTKIKFDFTGFS